MQEKEGKERFQIFHKESTSSSRENGKKGCRQIGEKKVSKLFRKFFFHMSEISDEKMAGLGGGESRTHD